MELTIVFKRCVLALLALILLAFVISPTVSALSNIDSAAIYGGWVNWVPNNGANKCQTGSTALSSGENKIKVWNYFIGKGLTPIVTAGMMGNFQAESHFESRLVQYGGKNSRGEVSVQNQPSSLDDTMLIDGKTGYGLAQWTTRGRQQGLHDLASSRQVNDSDLATQLDWVWQELNSKAYQDVFNQIKSSTDIALVNRVFGHGYEGYGTSTESTRLGFANTILVELGSSTPDTTATTSSTSTTSGGACASSASASAIVQTALLYSWPAKGHGLTPKPGYAAAIAKYNPGASAGGADCGVFVATVMIASGADPNYPKSGTSAQEAYVKNHPEKYFVDTSLNSNAEISKLQPGDILIVNGSHGGSGADGHTYIFVGNQSPDNFNEASASLNSRMPNLGNAEIVDSLHRGNYILARLKQ